MATGKQMCNNISILSSYEYSIFSFNIFADEFLLRFDRAAVTAIDDDHRSFYSKRKHHFCYRLSKQTLKLKHQQLKYNNRPISLKTFEG